MDIKACSGTSKMKTLSGPNNILQLQGLKEQICNTTLPPPNLPVVGGVD